MIIKLNSLSIKTCIWQVPISLKKGNKIKITAKVNLVNLNNYHIAERNLNNKFKIQLDITNNILVTYFLKIWGLLWNWIA